MKSKISEKQYLDFPGLTKYDENIKEYIADKEVNLKAEDQAILETAKDYTLKVNSWGILGL